MISVIDKDAKNTIFFWKNKLTFTNYFNYFLKILKN